MSKYLCLLVVILLGAPSLTNAQPADATNAVEALEMLTSEDVAKALQKFLTNPAYKARADAFRHIAGEPTSKDFSYKKDKKDESPVYQLTWKVTPKPGVPQSVETRAYLRALLIDILEQGDKGLQPADARKLDVTIEFVNAALPQWYYVLYYCYSHCRCEWVYVGYAQVPLVATQPKGLEPEEPVKKADKKAKTPSLEESRTKPAVRPKLTDDGLIDDYPKDAETCYRRGLAAYRQRNYAVARAYINQAVKLDAEDARFWYVKAMTELVMDDERSAQASARQAHALQNRPTADAQQVDTLLAQAPESARQFLLAQR